MAEKRLDESSEVGWDKMKLRLSTAGGKMSRRELLKMALPLGKVTLDSTRCTLCGLCAADCPTGALAISPEAGTGVYQLLFKHHLCVACGDCVKVCPEQCLRLERTIELGKLGAPATVLFEDVMVRCAECGQAVGPRSMVESIKAKLMAAGQSLPEEIGLCPECKVRAQFKSWGVVRERVKPEVAEDRQHGRIS